MELLLAFVVRWIHIGSAILIIGGPFFVRFALLPAAAKTLDDSSQQKLRSAIDARWRKFVYTLITLFIITGLVQFLVPLHDADGNLLTARWKDFSADDKKMYHMIFGIKMIAAFGIFFLASALAGRSQTFAPIRKNAKLYLGIFLLTAGLLIACSTMLRYFPHEPLATAQVSVPAHAAATRPAGTRPNRFRQRGRFPPGGGRSDLP